MLNLNLHRPGRAAWLKELPTRHLILYLAELADLDEQRVPGTNDARDSIRRELRQREWNVQARRESEVG